MSAASFGGGFSWASPGESFLFDMFSPLQRGLGRLELFKAGRFSTLRGVHLVSQFRDGFIGHAARSIQTAERAVLRQRVPGRERYMLRVLRLLVRVEILLRYMNGGDLDERRLVFVPDDNRVFDGLL